MNGLFGKAPMSLAMPAMTLAVLILIGTVLLPMPPWLMDLFLTLNLASSIVLVLSVLFSETPLGLAVFPTILLCSTVFRLSLNIASTRLILGSGGEGTAAAGHVIEALGGIIVRGNFVVGLILFVVIIAIQYVVINHGAVRISEVSARFVLDAMPGKQMSIDADLNAGLIDEAAARVRRDRIQKEAEFYGSMDGAVKFTQRDSVAGLLIVMINIVGGFVIGIAQNGMGLAEAFETFTTLTVGDGLANAIPSLLVSVSAALLTTRASASSHVGDDVAGQILTRPAPLVAASLVTAVLALAPGLPMMSFLLLAGGLGFAARRAMKLVDAPSDDATAGAAVAPPPPEPLERLVRVDRLAIELGFELLPLVGNDEAGLPARLKALRRGLASSMGLVLPMVRIRDNPQSAPNAYGVLINGNVVARGELMMGHLLVVDSGLGAPLPPGIVGRDPAFGLEAVWVPDTQRAAVEAAGHMVIDPLTVLVTHFSEVAKTHAHELLGRQDVKALVDTVAEANPKVVEELTPKLLTIGQVQKVLASLLREQVPIRDLVSILEALADAAPTDTTTPFLTEQVRLALRRAIVSPHMNEGGELYAVTTSPELEQSLFNALRGEPGASLPRPVDLMSKLQAAVGSRSGPGAPILLTSPRVRSALRTLLEPYLPSLPVLAHTELPPDVRVVSLGMVT